MRRFIWSEKFNLEVGELHDAHAAGLTDDVVANDEFGFTASPNSPLHPSSSTPPGPGVALRWVTHPVLGFPSSPFKVWRRSREHNVDMVTLFNDASTVTTFRCYTFDRRMYRIFFRVIPDPGRKVRVQAMDEADNIIPGQSHLFSSAGFGGFQYPGMKSLLVSGQGKIERVSGVTEREFSKPDGWKLVEVVGLPFNPDEVDSGRYDATELQGLADAFITSPSLTGTQAARRRMAIANAMATGLPGGGERPAGISWQLPDVSYYLDQIRGDLNDVNPESTTTMRLIKNCIERSRTNLPHRMQVHYNHEQTVEGIRQADLEDARGRDDSPAVFSVPVVGSTMLSVATDSEAATALGYGTIDFPDAVHEDELNKLNQFLPTDERPPAHDYMVTGVFTLPLTSHIPGIDRDVELAALARPHRPPQPPANTRIVNLNINNVPDRKHFNRPPAMDQPTTEAVNITWDLADKPQGYLIARSIDDGDFQVLNSRSGLYPDENGHYLYYPQQPPGDAGDIPVDAKCEFTVAVSPVPLNGMIAHDFRIIARDVFGRWSDWKRVIYNATAIPPLRVDIHELELGPAPPVPGAAFGTPVSGFLRLDFSWDWSDRSPARIEFAGEFKGLEDDFETDSTVFHAGLTGTSQPLAIEFNPDGSPYIASAHHGTEGTEESKVTFVIVPPPEETESEPPEETVESEAFSPDVRRYRIMLRGVEYNFGTAKGISFTVRGRARESVRPVADDSFGPWSAPPRTGRCFNPHTPESPVLPAEVVWTALPDATGRARAMLRWDSVNGASGYFVWRSNETALRRALHSHPEIDEVPKTSSLVERATYLRDLLDPDLQEPGGGDENLNQLRSLNAFTRLNEVAITSTAIEVDIPGDSEVVYAYRISAVTEANMESPRSDDIFWVAVPKANIPEAPNLLLRKSGTEDGGIRIHCHSVQGTRTPAGYRIYRRYGAKIIDDLGLMGPPVIDYDDLGWQEFDGPQPLRDSAGFCRSIDDPVSPGWQPYTYMVTAIGRNTLGRVDVDREYSGESCPSSLQHFLLPPPYPPDISRARFSESPDGTSADISFYCDLPVLPTKLGEAEIIITRSNPTDDRSRMTKTELLRFNPRDIPVYTLPAGAFAGLSHVSHDELVELFEMVGESGGIIDPPEGICRWETGSGMPLYTMVVDGYTGPHDFTLSITAIDPLGRRTDKSLTED